MRRFEVCTDPATAERFMRVWPRGADLKNDPLLNKGTTFSPEERRAFGLEGLVPPAVATAAEQQNRAYGNYLKCHTDVDRYLNLTALQDRNETLFYRLLIDHIEEMMPIVYTPTVGKACEQYSHLYRKSRGVYISLEQRGRMAEILRNAPVDDCRVMVVTDNEAILGLGDLGVGGMGIPIGKLTLYTAGAGIHPAHCLPVDLDVGTNNTALLEDPLYLGLRRHRARGEEYFSFLDEFVDAVAEAYPDALVQWEDFANENAFRILQRYRDRVPSFDDDIQGTGAVIVAGVLTAVQRCGRSLRDERMVVFGAGASGGGCALAMRAALRAEGLSTREARERVVCLDSRGLILADRPGLAGHKAALAADPVLARNWSGGTHGVFWLEDVVRNFRPTILLGMSGQPGSFTEEIVRTMHSHCERPILFPCSNPTRMAEATPTHLVEWTNGAALIGTGSPFAPVRHEGVTYEIGQANNVLIFPGVGLGALAVRAKHLPREAFLAAARALAGMSAGDAGPGASIFPPLRRLREISHVVGTAVARSLVESGAAPECGKEEIDRNLAALVWDPVYLPYRPA